MVYLLKEKAKPVAVNKKRRKIALLNLPGEQAPQQQAYPDMQQQMDVDLNDDKSVNAAKWPQKRGGRGQKE